LAAETIVITSPTAQAYAELQAAFDHYNRELFGGELPPCLITMQREKRTYGYFSSERFVHRHDRSKTDEIAINPSYFAVVPLLEVLQTLVHEMVHAWQFHFGKPPGHRQGVPVPGPDDLPAHRGGLAAHARPAGRVARRRDRGRDLHSALRWNS